MANKAEVIYTDTPMSCCGMGMAHGFTESIQTLRGKDRWGFADFDYRAPTQQDVEDRLTQLIGTTADNRRNCAMIVLSEAQQMALDAAKKLGFEVVKEFWNPNSGNQCYIMVYTHFDSEDDYDNEWD